VAALPARHRRRVSLDPRPTVNRVAAATLGPAVNPANPVTRRRPARAPGGHPSGRVSTAHAPTGRRARRGTTDPHSDRVTINRRSVRATIVRHSGRVTSGAHHSSLTARCANR